MSTMLKTTNPAAVLPDPALPKMGEFVVYRPRLGEFKRGKSRFPALVLDVDAANRQLDLIVFFDADDLGGLRGVPRVVGSDRGWDYLAPELTSAAVQLVAPTALSTADVLAQLSDMLLGNYERPVQPVVEILNEFEDRLAALELAAKPKPKPQPPKRKPPKRWSAERAAERAAAREASEV